MERLPHATTGRRLLLPLVALATATTAAGETLEDELRSRAPAEIAADARQLGDARRGAVVFYQPHLACRRCHAAGNDQSPLGPDLTKLGSEADDAHLVESVLVPSKVIGEGYRPVTLVTASGKVATGLLVADGEKEIVIREGERDFQRSRYLKADIVRVERSDLSIMPAGQVNTLHSRQQFLDLIAYLRALRDGGAARAAELEPPPALYGAGALPEYESRLDHAGLIASLDPEAFRRGEAIYSRLCVNCHGTREAPGSLPTSLRFASGAFKNGSDPYSMYRTLTAGFGLMAPQSWMVPTQKYDVIHYVREAYLREHNPTQHFAVDGEYLRRLPRGDTRGPAPLEVAPWESMDYGPNLMLTLEVGRDASNFAYKGHAIRLDAGPGGVTRGRYWLLYDHDTLRVAAAWSGPGFIDFDGINFNGRHAVHPRVTGEVHAANPTGPGWGRPGDGIFDDPRLAGRDGRLYGPLPRAWAHYKGTYQHGARTILRYTVGDAEILECPGILPRLPEPVFTRAFDIGPRAADLILQVAHCEGSGAALELVDGAAVFGEAAPQPAAGGSVPPASAPASERGGGAARHTVAGTAGATQGLEWLPAGSDLRLRIPAGGDRRRFTLWFTATGGAEQARALAAAVVIDSPDEDLRAFTRGGPSRWPEVLATKARCGADDGPFAVDVLEHPTDNPWFCRLRLSGLDFAEDGDSLYASTWDGNVWLVSGLRRLPREVAAGSGPREVGITWRRIASGLFQPLGLKVAGGRVHVACRDQICILHDLNGDGESDWYESFNNDHQVTDHFHEFAMGLQVDDEGRFYYAKSARHALPALVPHHGTLLRVEKDGSRTDILATGFRAANGVCLNPDGTFFVTDQEGHWNPKNRINHVRAGGFYGNMLGYHDVTDSSDEAMEEPLCWITNSFDRSPAELLWVESGRWGPLEGRLLNLSYGYGMVYTVSHETVGGKLQGGLCAVEIPRFPTGIMRGRFSPDDGQLYLAGLSAWASSQEQPGGIYRLRATGKPMHLPIGLEAKRTGMKITFTEALDRETAADVRSYSVKVWGLKRSANYGSNHIGERELAVAGARAGEDGRSVFLEIPGIAPTWSMEIRWRLRSEKGQPFAGAIHNTIHRLGE
jgi:putative heme-binding domain-containing protein